MVMFTYVVVNLRIPFVHEYMSLLGNVLLIFALISVDLIICANTFNSIQLYTSYMYL